MQHMRRKTRERIWKAELEALDSRIIDCTKLLQSLNTRKDLIQYCLEYSDVNFDETILYPCFRCEAQFTPDKMYKHLKTKHPRPVYSRGNQEKMKRNG